MALRINGRTRLAGVVGWPLDHTLSPVMHNAAYEDMGLDAVYVPLPVRNEAELHRVVSAVRVLPFMGFNVTMPFKQAVFALCDEVAAQARLAGAVNTVHCSEGRLIGYNTDGRGSARVARRGSRLLGRRQADRARGRGRSGGGRARGLRREPGRARRGASTAASSAPSG